MEERLNYDQHIPLRIKASVEFYSVSKSKYFKNKHKNLQMNTHHTLKVVTEIYKVIRAKSVYLLFYS